MTNDRKHRDIVDGALSLLARQLGDTAGASDVGLRDPQKALGVLLDDWEAHYQGRVSPGAKTWVHELKDLRNAWAHHDEISWDHAYRAVTSAIKLLEALSLDSAPLKPLLSSLAPEASPSGKSWMPSTPRVAIVTCTKLKRPSRSRAIEMYDRSPLFRLCIEAARRDDLPVLVVSSKYGVIDGDTVIDPYEADLKTMPESELDRWRATVASQLASVDS